MYTFSVLFNLYSNENENVIIREEFLRLMQVSECIFIQEFVQNLFSEVSFFFFLSTYFTWLVKFSERHCQL